VVEANGFSKAARRLKMPTSTVSRRIAELEHALGVRLMERSTRSLSLTDVGSEVLPSLPIVVTPFAYWDRSVASFLNIFSYCPVTPGPV
jgi:hypothetical protein